MDNVFICCLSVGFFFFFVIPKLKSTHNGIMFLDVLKSIQPLYKN